MPILSVFNMFDMMPIMMGFSFIMFALIFGLILFTIFRNIARERKNDKSPLLTVDATVVAKRTHVASHRRSSGVNHYSASTTYYATFQVESGDRMELHVAGHEFGMLIEGDRGNLTFQGTRYLGFERT